MPTSTHTIPPQNVQHTITLRKMEHGTVVDAISVKAPFPLPHPNVGEYYELSDNVDNIKISGFIIRINSKHGVSQGPNFTMQTEIIVE